MRSISGQLTPELSLIVGEKLVAKAPPLPIASFRDLMQHVARLAYANKDRRARAGVGAPSAGSQCEH